MLDQLNGQLTEIGESFLVNSVGLYVTEDSAELGRAVHATSDVGNKHKLIQSAIASCCGRGS